MRRTITLTGLSVAAGIALFSFALVANAAGPWYVDPAGSDANDCLSAGTACLTINGAIGKASAGDTINVAAGTYNEQVQINKQLTLNGAKVGVDARTRVATGESIIDNSCGPVQITADNVVLDGFTIQGSTLSDPCFLAGIWTNPGFSGTQGGHKIYNNIVQNNISGIELDNTGTFPTEVKFNYIKNNNNPGPGIGNAIQVNFGLSNALIDNNKFEGHTNSSFLIPGVTSSNITFSNNELVGGTSERVVFGSVSSSTISGNTSTGGTSSGTIRLFGGNNGIDVTGNTLANGVRGVRITNDFAPNSDITVNQNNLTGNSAAGLEVGTTAYSGGTGSLDATCNWWDSASGPTNAGNPGGTGDAVVDPDGVVDFTSWLTASAPGGPCNGPAPVTVTIVKYVDGQHADATNAEGLSFPMASCWSATNIGTGCGTFGLGPVGFNNPNPYEATTADMTSGASYSTNEDATGNNVGADCAAGKPFALVGYTTGDTYAQAASSSPATTSPAFTNITSNKWVLVWNKDCTPKLTVTKNVINDNGGTATTSDFTLFIDNATTTSGAATTTTAGAHVVSEGAYPGYTSTIGGDCDANGNVTLAAGDSKNCTITNDDIAPATTTLKVHVLKYLDGIKATAASSSSYQFPMTATWQTANLNGGATSTGNYVLGNFHGGAADQYGADTAAMESPANYSTHELTGGSGQPLAPGAACQSGMYRLVGYSTSAASFAAAASSSVSTTTPSFFGLTSDRYVIVWNEKCPTTTPPPPPPPANACSLSQAPSGYTLVNGSSGNDTVTLAPNTMYKGNGGNDTITAPDGNYIICTGNGNDKITIGNGDYTINAGGGNNTVTTGNGSGYITAGSGNDVITVGTGDHTINAGGGNNTIVTGDGTQNVTVLSGNDKVTTGSGNDTISAGGGNNIVNSGGGDDTITAGSGNDNVDGGSGTDSCSAGGGTNTVTNCP